MTNKWKVTTLTLLTLSVLCLAAFAWFNDYYSYAIWEGQKITVINQGIAFKGEAVPISGRDCENQHPSQHITCIVMFQVPSQSSAASSIGGIERIELVFQNTTSAFSIDVINIRFFSRTRRGTFTFNEPVVLVADGIKQELKIEGSLAKPWRRHPPDYTNTKAHSVTQYGGYEQSRSHEFKFYMEYPHSKFGLGINMGEVSTVKHISLYIPVNVNGVPTVMEFDFESETVVKKIKQRFGVPGMP